MEAPITEEQPERAEHTAETAGESVQFLSFTIDENEYAVDIMSVREVKGWTETTRLPNSPDYMRGVLNLRGIVVPIFDLRMRFGMGETSATEKHVIIILAVGERTVGILVDAVSDILTINSAEIKPAPSSEVALDEQFVDGLIAVEERMVVVLVMEKLLNNNLLDECIQQTH